MRCDFEFTINGVETPFEQLPKEIRENPIRVQWRNHDAGIPANYVYCPKCGSGQSYSTRTEWNIVCELCGNAMPYSSMWWENDFIEPDDADEGVEWTYTLKTSFAETEKNSRGKTTCVKAYVRIQKTVCTSFDSQFMRYTGHSSSSQNAYQACLMKAMPFLFADDEPKTMVMRKLAECMYIKSSCWTAPSQALLEASIEKFFPTWCRDICWAMPKQAMSCYANKLDKTHTQISPELTEAYRYLLIHGVFNVGEIYTIQKDIDGQSIYTPVDLGEFARYLMKYAIIDGVIAVSIFNQLNGRTIQESAKESLHNRGKYLRLNYKKNSSVMDMLVNSDWSYESLRAAADAAATLQEEKK